MAAPRIRVDVLSNFKILTHSSPTDSNRPTTLCLLPVSEKAFDRTEKAKPSSPDRDADRSSGRWERITRKIRLLAPTSLSQCCPYLPRTPSFKAQPPLQSIMAMHHETDSDCHTPPWRTGPFARVQSGLLSHWCSLIHLGMLFMMSMSHPLAQYSQTRRIWSRLRSVEC